MATTISARAHAGLRFDTRSSRLIIRLGTALAVVVALKSFLIDPLTGHFGGTLGDFSSYLGAARSMAAGGSPYAHFDPSTVVMSGFDYPPFAALVVRPLAFLSDQAAATVWVIASVIATVAAGIVVARTALPRSMPRVEIGILAALIFAPAAYSIWIGQVNGFIFLLVALAYRQYTRDRQVTTGVLLGLAAAIKIGPIVLLLLLLRRKWWRGAATMAATAFVSTASAGALIGLSAVHTFISTVLPALDRPVGWIYNQSVAASLSRVVSWSVLTVQPASTVIEVLGIVAGGGILVTAAWVTRSGARSSPERSAEFGLGVAAALLAGSLAWYSHFVLLLIPLLAAVGLANSRGWRNERQLVIASAAAVAVFGLAAPMVIGGLTMQGLVSMSQSPMWWLVVQLYSLPCIAAVWFFARLSTSLRRAPVAEHEP